MVIKFPPVYTKHQCQHQRSGCNLDQIREARCVCKVPEKYFYNIIRDIYKIHWSKLKAKYIVVSLSKMEVTARIQVATKGRVGKREQGMIPGVEST